MRECVEDAVRMARVRTHGTSIRIALDSPDGPVLATVQRQRLEQVFLNLVVNAVDAIEETRKGAGTISIGVGAAGQGVRISVQDDGPGLAPGAAARLFEPFFTTKPSGKGTGLGLALSREMLAGMAGRIDFEAPAGGGALFTVTLPRLPAPVLGGARASGAGPGAVARP